MYLAILKIQNGIESDLANPYEYNLFNNKVLTSLILWTRPIGLWGLQRLPKATVD